MCTGKVKTLKGGASMNTSKFLGVGLVNAIGLFLLFIVFINCAKVISVKYPITGVSELIQAV